MRTQIKEGNGIFFWFDGVACFSQRSKETNVRRRLQWALTDAGEIILTCGFISQNENPSTEKNERSAGNLPSTNWTLWVMTDRGTTSIMLSEYASCNKINLLMDAAHLLPTVQSCPWWRSQFKCTLEEGDFLLRKVNLCKLSMWLLNMWTASKGHTNQTFFDLRVLWFGVVLFCA